MTLQGRDWEWRQNLEALMLVAMSDWNEKGSQSAAQTYAQCVTALHLSRIANALEALALHPQKKGLDVGTRVEINKGILVGKRGTVISAPDGSCPKGKVWVVWDGPGQDGECYEISGLTIISVPFPIGRVTPWT